MPNFPSLSLQVEAFMNAMKEALGALPYTMECEYSSVSV